MTPIELSYETLELAGDISEDASRDEEDESGGKEGRLNRESTDVVGAQSSGVHTS